MDTSAQMAQLRSQLSASLNEQSRMENDILQLNNELVAINEQLRLTRVERDQNANKLVLEKMQFMNERADLENEMHLREKKMKQEHKAQISKLEAELQVYKLQDVAESPKLPSKSPSTGSIATSISANSTASNNGEIERLRTELDRCQRQNEVMTREYLLRHEKVTNEAQALREVNVRLMEENEGFQLLLAEKTVSGQLESSLEAELLALEQEESLENKRTPEDQKLIYELQFERQSLLNYNNALKLSLQRLVQRLIEFKEFERIVEDAPNGGTRSVSAFQQRTATAAAVIRQKRQSSASSVSALSTSSSNGAHVSISSTGTSNTITAPSSTTKNIRRTYSSRPPSVWSQIMFGQPNQNHQPNNSNCTSNSLDGIDGVSISSSSSSGELDAIATDSSASSIKSCESVISAADHVLAETNTPRRSSTPGQHKLRKLRMAKS